MTRIKPKEMEVVIYKSSDGSVQMEVNLKKDNVWLTQAQIATLFGVGRNTITRHINNIFRNEELESKSNVQKLYIANSDKPVKLYSLDLTLSVGYRVNSLKATQFRIWATKIIKNHLLLGYTVNEKVLISQKNKFRELQNAIDFIENKAHNSLLRDQSTELLSIIKQYTKSLDLLKQYDDRKIKYLKGTLPTYTLTTQDTKENIEKIRNSLAESKKNLGFFGIESSDKVSSIIGNLNQTFGGKQLYKTIEERAANLLYLIIKDHPFIDGNKRIGSLLFIHYLDKNDILYRKSGERKINDNALVALALLVAISNPIEKDILIRVVISIIS